MLFIHGSLAVGGVETFYIRMAKERAKIGLSTIILLLDKPESSNQELLTEAKKYAKVLFQDDVFFNYFDFTCRLTLINIIRRKSVIKLLYGVEQVHVYDAMHALMWQRFAKILDKNIPVTVGFYHYIKYLWGADKVAFYERTNRRFVFDYLPKECLLFFSEGNRQLYTKYKKIDFTHSNIFRLGVVDKKDPILTGKLNETIRIIAVGRLVEFKTYNFYMLEVIKNLVSMGYAVQLDIYGYGPLKLAMQNKIKLLNIADNVCLKGALDYLKYDEVVSQYDLFIGSGTAIIQAAALGVPSIVGVENVVAPKSYGYFNDVYQYEYNLKGLDLPLISVENMILDFINLDTNSRLNLKQRHVLCTESFTNEVCQKSMDNLQSIDMPIKRFKYNRFLYTLSRFFDHLNMKFNKAHPRSTQFDDFRAFDEK